MELAASTVLVAEHDDDADAARSLHGRVPIGRGFVPGTHFASSGASRAPEPAWFRRVLPPVPYAAAMAVSDVATCLARPRCAPRRLTTGGVAASGRRAAC